MCRVFTAHMPPMGGGPTVPHTAHMDDCPLTARDDQCRGDSCEHRYPCMAFQTPDFPPLPPTAVKCHTSPNVRDILLILQLRVLWPPVLLLHPAVCFSSTPPRPPAADSLLSSPAGFWGDVSGWRVEERASKYVINRPLPFLNRT